MARRIVSATAEMHLQTAELLMQGIKELVKVLNSGDVCTPPEHSVNSVKRRCVQARQELLQVQHQLEEWWKVGENG